MANQFYNNIKIDLLILIYYIRRTGEMTIKPIEGDFLALCRIGTKDDVLDYLDRHRGFPFRYGNAYIEACQSNTNIDLIRMLHNLSVKTMHQHGFGRACEVNNTPVINELLPIASIDDIQEGMYLASYGNHLELLKRLFGAYRGELTDKLIGHLVLNSCRDPMHTDIIIYLHDMGLPIVKDAFEAASYYGDRTIFRLMLNEPEAKESYVQAMKFACGKGHIDFIQELYPSVTLTDEEKDRCFRSACELEDEKTIDLLCGYGWENPNYLIGFPCSRLSQDTQITSWNFALDKGFNKGNLVLAKKAVEMGATNDIIIAKYAIQVDDQKLLDEVVQKMDSFSKRLIYIHCCKVGTLQQIDNAKDLCQQEYSIGFYAALYAKKWNVCIDMIRNGSIKHKEVNEADMISLLENGLEKEYFAGRLVHYSE